MIVYYLFISIFRFLGTIYFSNIYFFDFAHYTIIYYSQKQTQLFYQNSTKNRYYQNCNIKIALSKLHYQNSDTVIQGRGSAGTRSQWCQNAPKLLLHQWFVLRNALKMTIRSLLLFVFSFHQPTGFFRIVEGHPIERHCPCNSAFVSK